MCPAPITRKRGKMQRTEMKDLEKSVNELAVILAECNKDELDPANAAIIQASLLAAIFKALTIIHRDQATRESQ